MQVGTSVKPVLAGSGAGWSRIARVLVAPAEYLLLTALVVLFIVRGFLPAWQSLNTDFRNYYVAARLYRDGSSLLRVYDFTWFQRQKDHAGMEMCQVGFVPDTLLSALPIVPLAGLPPLTAKRFWLVINGFLLALSTLLLKQITQLGWRRVLIIVFLAVEPLAKSFLYGQMHLCVFFLLALAVWLVRRQRPFGAGISVALAAGLKLYPAIFLAFFLRKKQWHAISGTTVAMVILGGLSIYLFGINVHHIYLGQILPAIGRGENIDPYAPGWNSLTALLHRAFIREPEMNPHPLLHLPELYALVQPLCQAVIFLPAVGLLIPGVVRREHEQLEWAAFAAMLLALSTGPTSYHLCVLILPAALALDSLLAEGRRPQAWILLGLYGTTCLPLNRWASRDADGWRMFLASPRLYPLLGLLCFLYWILWVRPAVRQRIRTHAWESAAFGGLFLILAVGGSFQAFHHLRNLFDNYPHRLFNLQGSLRKGEPAIGARGLYFTRMAERSPSFEAWLWAGGRFDILPPAEDEFHPATAPGLADVWVEISGPVSNIVRFSNFASASAPAPRIEVINGEQPSVSLDGKWLAFIREHMGRGELWIKAIAQSPGSPGGEERVMVAASSDVWEAAVEPGDRRIVFTAAPKGRPELFSLDMASGRVDSMPIVGPARYPAFSPDGRWLAYSRCEQGTWHLYVTDLTSGSSRRLTQGDCNSISPVWEPGSKSLIYSTDCGRGLEMTALARIEFSP